VAQPLIVTFGDVLALALITPPGGLLPETSTPVEATLTVGGQAAVTACWVVEAGGLARAVGARAYDRLGDLVEAELTERGVELAGPGVEGRTGLITVVDGPGTPRTALADRGVSPLIGADSVDEDLVAGADILHVSGYALADQPSAGAAERAAELARAAGARISVDLASASLVTPLVRQRIADLAPDIVLATEQQSEAAGGLDDLAALQVLSDAGGAAAAPPAPGARDAFAGGVLPALALGGALEDAVAYGHELAARCAGSASPLP
jgi:ribokinase